MKQMKIYGKLPFYFRIGQAMSKKGYLSCNDVAANEIVVIDSKDRAIALSDFLKGC